MYGREASKQASIASTGNDPSLPMTRSGRIADQLSPFLLLLFLLLLFFLLPSPSSFLLLPFLLPQLELFKVHAPSNTREKERELEDDCDEEEEKGEERKKKEKYGRRRRREHEEEE